MEGPQQTSAWSCFILLAQHPSPNISTRTPGVAIVYIVLGQYGSSKTHPMLSHDWHIILLERLGPKCPCCFDWPPSSETRCSFQMFSDVRRQLKASCFCAKWFKHLWVVRYTISMIGAPLELYNISGFLTVLPSPALPTRVARWLTWALPALYLWHIYRFCRHLCSILQCT